ncbi:MAG: hypothetical protein V4671_17250 [Armatimonadota bacterium]
MSKRSQRNRDQQLYERVVSLSGVAATPRENEEADDRPSGHESGPIADDILARSPDLSRILVSAAEGKRELTKMKKFRFQLLHQWMQAQIEPCRVADIGGGKGLLAHLLNQSGWQATVVDPVSQGLPTKYKDLQSNRQVQIAATESVNRRDSCFDPEMAQDFDLLVAMHAHGCNIQLIDAAERFHRGFILLPCCIINEPLYPPPGMHWLQCVADYAKSRGFAIEPFRLNFKGQNIGLYARRIGSGNTT